jgi:hypothetical protein
MDHRLFAYTGQDLALQSCEGWLEVARGITKSAFARWVATSSLPSAAFSLCTTAKPRLLTILESRLYSFSFPWKYVALENKNTVTLRLCLQPVSKILNCILLVAVIEKPVIHWMSSGPS